MRRRKGAGTFSLEPPADLNLAAGWPIFKSDARHTAEVRYDSYREKLAPATSALPIVGLPPSKTAAPTEDALVRVEPAVRWTIESSPPPSAREQKSSARRRHACAGRSRCVTRPRPGRVRPCRKRARSQWPLRPLRLHGSCAHFRSTQLRRHLRSPSLRPPARLGKLSRRGRCRLAGWLIRPPCATSPNNGTRGERVYLRGQFVVNFADGNRAVLRPTTASRRFLAQCPHHRRLSRRRTAARTRLHRDRDAQRPYEVTEVRQQSDGQLNVFVREIIRQ